MKTCHYCAKGEDELGEGALRPYGPGSAAVCWPCITATPERYEAADAVFAALAEAAAAMSPAGAAVDDGHGPRPASVEELVAMGVTIVEVGCGCPDCPNCPPDCPTCTAPPSWELVPEPFNPELN